ncbi:hypothetical protein HY374_02595 [Candidatus Berkelbacteria bacterium]|nr:hypothetical protein [Candidatus Berkelbacteria bacterium]
MKDNIHDDDQGDLHPVEDGPRLKPVEAADEEEDRAHLDREHQAHISEVENCDAATGKRENATSKTGLMVEQEQELTGQRKSLGSDEHLNAIEQSGWFAYERLIRVGSRLAMILDAILWTGLWAGIWWLWKQYYEDSDGAVPVWLYFIGLPLVPLASLLAARAAKGLGQHVTVTRFTNPDSVKQTIDTQIRVAGKSAVIAGALLLAIMALTFFAPPSWSSWVSYLGGLVAFGANIALGFSAGVGGNAADILAKPTIRDNIDCQVHMKRRTRRILRKYLKAVVLATVLLGLSGISHAAEAVWVWAIDVTDSVDRAQGDAAVGQLIEIAPERAARLGADAILIVKFGQDVMLSEMIWIPVPTELALVDCSRAKPKPMLTKGIGMLSPTQAAGRKQDAVEACSTRLLAEQQVHAEQLQLLKERLHASTRVTPRANVRTRIVPLLEWLVSRPSTVAIDVVTDGIDNSGIPLSRLQIPERVMVTFIITRPNPKRKRPTVDDVLSAAEAWSRLPGVMLMSAGEYAGIWERTE